MISDITTKCWILAMFVRDDGERLLLGDAPYEFDEKQKHFTANKLVNDTVDLQGSDGLLLAGQVRRAGTQKFSGYIGDFTTEKEQIEQYRRDFLKFFRKNYYYEVIYIFPDGTAIKRDNGFLVDAPEVEEIMQISPEWSVSLNFEDVSYYSYAENSQGEEIYSGMAVIPLSAVSSGGAMWDATGLVWDSVGITWEEGGGGGTVNVEVDSIDNVYPLLTITGPANNPVIENLTTNTRIEFSGNVTSSQILKVDSRNQTATLNGTSVITRLEGDWLYFAPGTNRVVYSADNDDAPNSEIQWSEVVG